MCPAFEPSVAQRCASAGRGEQARTDDGHEESGQDGLDDRCGERH
jgi:hypothetical protein